MKNNTIQLADIPLPSSEMLERQVIADAINIPDLLGEVSLIIDEDSFSDENRKYLWKTILWMYSTRKPIDLVSVWQLTGQIFIDEIQSQRLEVSTDMGFLSHAKLLHIAETKRRAYFAALTIVQQSAQPQTSEDDIFSAADELSHKIQGERKIGAETPLNAVLGMVADETEAMQQDAMQGKAVKVPTSLPSLDWLTFGGFGKGNLVILAARPSVGKTALMLQMAKTAAENNIPSLIFSLEMTKEELGKRLLFSTGYVNQTQMAGKNVNWDCFERARSIIDSLPIYINDEARSLSAISARLSSAVSQNRCGVAFIDYLSLIKFSPNSNINYSQQIGFVTAELKSLAKRLRIPIVLLVQINRAMVQESSPAPQLFHLKDSGNIEQDADIVLMLAQNGEDLDLWVRKNRNFKKDLKIALRPDNAYTSFHEIARPDWYGEEPPTPVQEHNFEDSNEPF